MGEDETLTRVGRGEWIGVPIFISLYVGGLILMREALGIGWGNITAAAAGEGGIPAGLAYTVSDHLSHASWAQQALHGRFPFGDLFTIEPHDAVLAVPYFWLVGKLAAAFAVHPLNVMILLALPSAALALTCIYLAAREMGLSIRAAVLAMVFVATGGGLSVPAQLLFPDLEWLRGVDANAIGSLPASKFLYFPYASASFAALWTALYLAARGERALRQGAGSWPWLVLLAAAAFALSGTRPYEPVLLLVIYAFFVVLTGLVAGMRARLHPRIIILLVLLASALPQILYNAWVAQQPLWDEFSELSLHNDIDRMQWFVGFGLFWPLAAVGAVIGLRERQLNVNLVSIIAVYVLLLVILDRNEGALLSGGFGALAILSALASDRIWQRITAFARPIQQIALAGFLCILFSTGFSLVFLVNKEFRRTDFFRIEPELLVIAEAIAAVEQSEIPVVLTDLAAGQVLPGLAVVRVYAGHWSLTRDVAAKIRKLTAAGFETRFGYPASDPRQIETALDELLMAERFDYLVVRRMRPAAALLERRAGVERLIAGRTYLLYRFVN